MGIFLLLRSRHSRQGFRATIEREDFDPKCKVCGKVGESVGHLARG